MAATAPVGLSSVAPHSSRIHVCHFSSEESHGGARAGCIGEIPLATPSCREKPGEETLATEELYSLCEPIIRARVRSVHPVRNEIDDLVQDVWVLLMPQASAVGVRSRGWCIPWLGGVDCQPLRRGSTRIGVRGSTYSTPVNVYVPDKIGGVVLYPGVDQLGVLGRNVDLVAQVSGTTVSSYSWSTTGVPLASLMLGTGHGSAQLPLADQQHDGHGRILSPCRSPTPTSHTRDLYLRLLASCREAVTATARAAGATPGRRRWRRARNCSRPRLSERLTPRSTPPAGRSTRDRPAELQPERSCTVARGV